MLQNSSHWFYGSVCKTKYLIVFDFQDVEIICFQKMPFLFLLFTGIFFSLKTITISFLMRCKLNEPIVKTNITIFFKQCLNFSKFST